MGKGDKKSRRGKIIIGSSGVRRPKPSNIKGIAKVETAPVEVVEKIKKPAEKPKTEPKTKIKAADSIAVPEPETAVAPVKTVKKAVKKTIETKKTDTDKPE